ncbi:MAG: hypothetical protein Q9166_008163 [cf. Caloplaca sp. 2 TL-2023]
MLKALILVLFANLYRQISLCHGLPPQAAAAAPGGFQRIALNTSSPAVYVKDPSLTRVVNDLLVSMRNYDADPIIRTARLVVVVIGSLNPAFTTYDPHLLRQLTLIFHIDVPSTDADLKTILTIENIPTQWSEWDEPRRRTQWRYIWEHEHEINWMEVQALMNVDIATRRLVDKGFVWPFRQIEVSKFGRQPLAYCFRFRAGPAETACVDVVTGNVFLPAPP